MKNYAIISATLLAAAAMAGCKKEQGPAETVEETKMSAMSAAYAPSFTYYEYGRDITEDDFLKNDHDAADEAFNYLNHAMTLGLLEIYQNNASLMAAIVSEIDASKNKELNLFHLAQDHPEVNGIMNRIFAARFKDFGGNNWQGYVTQRYVYDTAYVPFIGFMNLGTVNAGAKAYVSEPLELNEEKFTQFDDDYPMWIKDGEQLRFTSVNEEMGYYLTNPIVRISNGFEGDDLANYTRVPCRFEENGRDISVVAPTMGPGAGNGSLSPIPGGGGTGGGSQQPQADEWLTHVKFQINERYENWGKSEYQFAWAYGSGFNPVNFTWPEYSGPIRTIEKNVKKEDIGTMIPFYFDVFASVNYKSPSYLRFRIAHMPASTYCYYAVAAYERDWGAGHKRLFHLCGSDKTTEGPRKYSNEWYFIDPSNNNSYPFNVRNPNYHTSYWNYIKGTLQLHRWNL